MKTFATLAALCLTATFVGCQSTSDMGTVSPAAVSECGTNCEEACCDKADASMGAVGGSECSGGGGTCPVTGTSYGAVSDKPSCSGAAPSSGACPSSKSAPGDA